MATKTPQNFQNHARLVPGYHYVTFSLLLVNLVWSAYRAITAFSMDALMSLVVAIALILVAFYARVFALTAQDRIIRLEMNMRLRELLPPDLLNRASALTVQQLVALRFAGDSELPELCRQVLDGTLSDQKSIKQRIRDWEGDFLRV